MPVKLFVKWISCIAAILIMAEIMPGRVRYSDYVGLVTAGTLIWLINTIVRPFLRIISLPITILTLGLFTLILNTLMVMLADALLNTVSFGGFWPSFLLALLVSAIQMVLMRLFRKN